MTMLNFLQAIAGGLMGFALGLLVLYMFMRKTGSINYALHVRKIKRENLKESDLIERLEKCLDDWREDGLAGWESQQSLTLYEEVRPLHEFLKKTKEGKGRGKKEPT